MESTTKLIVHSSSRHRVQCFERHVQRILGLPPLRVTHQVFQRNGTWKFRCPAKTAVGCIVVVTHLLVGSLKCGWLNCCDGSAAVSTQLPGEFVCCTQYLFVITPPRRRHILQNA